MNRNLWRLGLCPTHRWETLLNSPIYTTVMHEQIAQTAYIKPFCHSYHIFPWKAKAIHIEKSSICERLPHPRSAHRASEWSDSDPGLPNNSSILDDIHLVDGEAWIIVTVDRLSSRAPIVSVIWSVRIQTERAALTCMATVQRSAVTACGVCWYTIIILLATCRG